MKTLEEGRTVNSVAFSPDGRTLATGVRVDLRPKPENGHITLWDTGTWARKTAFCDSTLEAMAFSPSGTLMAAFTLGSWTQIFDTRSGALLRTMKGFRESARGGAFSPDGRKLAGASMDGTVTIWDVMSGRILAALLMLPSAAMKPTVAGMVQAPGQYVAPPPSPFGAAAVPGPDPAQREWIAFTPAGYYTGSDDAEAFIQWESAKGRVPGAEYRSRFRRPDEVAKAPTRPGG